MKHHIIAYSKRHVSFPLLMIACVGLLLRVMTLGQQAPWFDEAQWVHRMIETPGLLDWLIYSDYANRDMVPLYFILEHFWYHHIWSSVYGMRLLSIFFGMMTIGLIYYIGRKWFNHQTGLLAALFCALSPYQINFSQELRPYGLMTLMSLISIYTLYQGLYQHKRSYWIINIIINSLLMWTHLFGLWLIMTEGLFLLIYHIRPFRRFFRWCLINMLLMIPIALLAMTWEHPGDPPLICPWYEFIATWICNDGYYLLLCVFYRTLTLSSDLFPHYPILFLTMIPICCTLFSLIFLGASCSYLITVRRYPASFTSFMRHPSKRRETARLLVFWYVVPGLLLCFFSLAIVPAFQLRYVIYSSPALYLMTAAGLQHYARSRFSKRVTILLIMTLASMGLVQQFIPIRSADVNTALYVQSHIKPDEIVIWEPHFFCEAFKFNPSPSYSPLPIINTRRILDNFSLIEKTIKNNTGIWVIFGYTDWIQATKQATLCEHYFQLRHIDYKKICFPGRWDNVVYYCSKNETTRPLTEPAALFEAMSHLDSDVYNAPIRWMIVHALIETKRYSEAIDLCSRELKNIPLNSDQASMIQQLEILEWDTYLPDGKTVLDQYIVDFIKELLYAYSKVHFTHANIQQVNAWKNYFNAFPNVQREIGAFLLQVAEIKYRSY